MLLLFAHKGIYRFSGTNLQFLGAMETEARGSQVQDPLWLQELAQGQPDSLSYHLLQN